MLAQLAKQLTNSAYQANANGDYRAAAEWCRKALSVAQDLPETWFNLCVAERGLGHREAALSALERARKTCAGRPDALNDIGLQYLQLQSHEHAEACFRSALRRRPDFALAYSNLGLLHTARLDYTKAESCFRQGISCAPTLGPIHLNLGTSLWSQSRHREALSSLEQALRLDPNQEFLQGQVLHARRMCHEWSGDEQLLNSLLERLRNGALASRPFELLSLVDDPALQRKLTERYAQIHHPERRPPFRMPVRGSGERIRIGYFSADFKEHPVATLIAGCIEHHDRSKFEVIGFSCSSATDSPIRTRLKRAFDRFLDVEACSDEEIAERARQEEIDIAIDLGGHTNGARPDIFAYRPAPIQAGYLGYLGTSGAPYMDYIIADAVTIPDASREHFTEKVIHLPWYQANDRQRTETHEPPSRADLGLPETAVVFCSFNNTYKITPLVFRSWMRILASVKNSVLYLLAGDATARAKLRMEASQLGISSERIIFGERLSGPEYLARYRAADLFLDTHPYNAGTTASDALWAGLPVLTCIGKGMQARMAASILHAAGQNQLIAPTPEEYESTAIRLGNNPQELHALRQQITASRSTLALFDVAEFTRHLDAALIEISRRHHAGEPVQHIKLPICI